MAAAQDTGAVRVMKLDDIWIDQSPPEAKPRRPPAETGKHASHNGMTDYNHVRSRETAVVLSEKCPIMSAYPSS